MEDELDNLWGDDSEDFEVFDRNAKAEIKQKPKIEEVDSEELQIKTNSLRQRRLSQIDSPDSKWDKYKI